MPSEHRTQSGLGLLESEVDYIAIMPNVAAMVRIVYDGGGDKR